MIAAVVRRVLPLVALAVVLGACVQRVRADSPASDMWFHLRLGHEFLSGWSIRNPGHLGAYDSASWTPTQWLPQMGMAVMEDRFGIGGVLWLAGTIHLVLILTIYVVCRREAAPLPAVMATALAFFALTYGLSPRPQVLSYLLLTVVVSAWLASERDGKARWWLVGLAWLWAPLHGMWPLAVIVGAVCVIGIALNRTFDRARVLRMAAIPLLSAVVPVLTPVGLDLYRSVLLVGGRADYFREWGPTDFHQPFAVVLVLMLAATVAHATRCRVSWMSLLLVLMAAGWAVYSSRTTPIAVVIVAPLLARSLQSLVPHGPRMGRAEWLSIGGVSVTAIAVLAVLTSSRGGQPAVPGWTDERLDTLPAGARVLDDWTSGPYYLWKHSDLSLVMHGYGDVFTDDEIERNRDIMQLSPGWDRLVADLEADAALVTTDSPLGYALAHDDRWNVVQSDHDFIFLVPKE